MMHRHMSTLRKTVRQRGGERAEPTLVRLARGRANCLEEDDTLPILCEAPRRAEETREVEGPSAAGLDSVSRTSSAICALFSAMSNFLAVACLPSSICI